MFLLAAGVAPAFGGIVYVDGSVAGPGSGALGDPYKVLYPTAINNTALGDTVMVAAGTYSGTVHILQDVVLVGADPATTFIDGNNGTRAVRIASAATASTLLQGFTIRDGVAIEGAGILMEKSASIRNCVIAGNVTTSNNGAGVQVYNGASGSFTNCTFAANTADSTGGGLSLQGPGASATLTNCILWDNTPNQINPAGGTVNVTYSDVQGGFAGDGNINSDPLFNDATNGDFTLDCASPCIDAGNPAGTDMGAFEATCLPPTVAVSGTVTSNCSGTLAGVTVDLMDGSGDFYTTHTDVNGEFAFASLASDPGTGEISITVPLGYQAGTPTGGEAAIVLDADHVQNFTVVCLPPAGTARSKNYWKHEASVALKGHGVAEESAANMTTNYPNAIFDHFHENGLNSIAVEGATYMAGPVPLDLDTILNTLKKKDSQVAKAKQQYLAVLLNMASGRILTSTVVSADGATASQAIQYMADLLNGPGSDSIAEDIAETMNDASLVGSGVIPLSYDDIAYARRRLAEQPLRVFPNPGSASRDYVFSFAMPAAGEASLEIFDVAGRRVAQPLAGAVDAGWRELRWDGRTLDGRRVGQGVYFARLTTPDGSRSVKFVHVAH